MAGPQKLQQTWYPAPIMSLIRDAAHTGCVIVLNNAYVITQPGLLSATISKTDVSCSGNNDGTITITSPSGGYGTYEYSINGGTTWQTSGSFNNLAPGTFDVRIRDAAHTACSVILYPKSCDNRTALIYYVHNRRCSS